MQRVYELADEPATIRLAQSLAAAGALLRGTCIGLRGDLGTGKTFFVRAFLHALGYRGRVKSPSFSLLEAYQVGGMPVFHLDLYRLAEPGEVDYLGLTDLEWAAGVLLIEWPERGAGHLPRLDLELRLEHLGMGRRARLVALTRKGRELLSMLAQPERD